MVRGVVAGPFAEWALFADIAGLDEALDHDLRIGGERQSGYWPLDDVHGLAAGAARVVVLANAPWDFDRGGGEERRVLGQRQPHQPLAPCGRGPLFADAAP